MSFIDAIRRLFRRETATLDRLEAMPTVELERLELLIVNNFERPTNWATATWILIYVKSELRGHIRFGAVVNLARLERGGKDVA